MEINTKQILEKAGEAAVKNLQDQMDQLGLNASGAAKASLSYTATDKALYIEGLERIIFLVFGRANGKRPPIKPLQDWVERKLGISKDESLGVAFAIAKKIEKEGTDIFTGKAKGLQIEVTLQMISAELLTDITSLYAQEITGGIIKEWGL